MIVRNETPIPNNTFANLVRRYQISAKSAANIISNAEVLAQAKETLTPAEFKSYCDAVGEDRKSSKCRILLIIGREAYRLKPFAHLLPANWTTIYVIASLPLNRFDRVTKDRTFGPTMTAADVKRIANGHSDIGGHLSKDFTIHLSGLTDPSTRMEVVDRMRDLQLQYGFRLEIGKGITEQMAKEQSAIKPVPAEMARQ